MRQYVKGDRCAVGPLQLHTWKGEQCIHCELWMPRLCRTCGDPIPVARLEAKPDAVQCTSCLTENGDEPPVAGHMIHHHKTGSEIEIGTRLAGERRSAHPRQGKSGAVQLGDCEFDAEEYRVVRFRPCKTHLDRVAVARGLCAECAIEWYRSRLPR